ncbi:MAG: TRM11 family SAM-dependent methyltransferase [Thermoguttaceae bacterium]
MSGTTRSMAPHSFLDAARYQGQVKGCTHVLYKYPARFSPVFARSAIETFTSPGQIVLDPFVGGGTTMVEARLCGRHAFGSDISSLAVFLTRAKAVPLSNADLGIVKQWFESITRQLNIRHHVENLRGGRFAGYDRNMPWRLRKLCEQYLASLECLPSHRHQRFARCVLLRCGQWAMDCRRRIPTVSEFKAVLADTLLRCVGAMQEYRLALAQAAKVSQQRAMFRCIQGSAAELKPQSFGNALRGGADLILTSPPYPGVHVLYHRWNVRGRIETPAPFWLANCLDGHGGVHYTLGDRRQDELKGYFTGIEKAFANIRGLLARDGLVIQLLAFSSLGWQLDAYLNAMKAAGYRELMPKGIGVNCSGRIWRPVPGRRWYSMIRGDISSSREVVLFHRKV